MKLFTKTLLVSALALAATGAAEARIQSIGDTTADGSELLLNVWNSTAQNSFTLDLGVTIEQFLANPSQALTFNLNDSNFQSFTQAYTAGNAVTWGVSGGHGILAELTDIPKFGFFTTAVAVPVLGLDSLGAVTGIDGSAGEIGNTMGVWDNLVGSIQTQLPGETNAVNNSTFRTVGEQGYTALYGNNLQNALPFVGQGDLGTALYFVHEKVNADDFDTGELEVFAGKWNLNVASSTLTYAAAPVSAVPVPAAVWMFGAGLMGVLRLNRRKSMAA